MNCYGCHVRDGLGGVEPDRDLAFETTQKEMGDEGRVPPLLTGVGGKLTEEWLKHVLFDGAKDRPYMLTKMPKFGEANVAHLVEPLTRVDALQPVPVPSFDENDKKVKAAGRFLVGSQAYNCGACHQFKEYQAAGIQALDMTLMTRRLRRDWFSQYVVNPPAFRPGTRMPSSWPDGKSMLDSVLDGDTKRQVESIWRYLSDGPSAAVPYGLGRDPMPLVADKEPVIYRNFIEGAGPRAIGVGYPLKANLAFDANNLRLALLWQGDFIDASRHWTGRGEGFQGPLGDNILTLPAGPAYAQLDNLAAPWPSKSARDLGQKFKGYELDATRQPVFHYQLNDVKVTDQPQAIKTGKSAGLVRTLLFESSKPVDRLYHRAAVGKKIEKLADSTYLVDGEWRLKLQASDSPVIREQGGKFELLIPITFKAGQSRLVEEFSW